MKNTEENELTERTMNIYSHLVVAKQLEYSLAPENREEFFWGAVAPDIRYLAGTPRNQTHLSRDQMISIYAQYPDLKSFLLGYFVHCLVDELDLTKMICSKFPLSLIRNRLSLRKAAVIVELYYQEKVHIDQKIQGTNNDFLRNLGIEQKTIETYANALNQYFSRPSFRSMVSISRALGFSEDPRIQIYINGANLFLETRW